MAVVSVQALAAAALMALAAAFLMSPGALAMEEGGGSSHGSGIGGTGFGGAALVLGVETLDVEDYGVDFDNDVSFMDHHNTNMQWLEELQKDFDMWLDTLDSELDLEDEVEAPMVPEVVNDAAEEMEGKEDVDVDMNGEDVDAAEEMHDFDVITAGEQCIVDVMFDIYHPKIYLDDDGIYRYIED